MMTGLCKKTLTHSARFGSCFPTWHPISLWCWVSHFRKSLLWVKKWLHANHSTWYTWTGIPRPFHAFRTPNTFRLSSWYYVGRYEPYTYLTRTLAQTKIIYISSSGSTSASYSSWKNRLPLFSIRFVVIRHTYEPIRRKGWIQLHLKKSSFAHEGASGGDLSCVGPFKVTTAPFKVTFAKV